MEARYQTAPSPDQYSWEGCDLPDPRDALPNCAKPRPVFLGRVRPSRSSGRATKLRQAPTSILGKGATFPILGTRYQTAPSPDQYSWEGCDLPDPRDALPNCAKPRPRSSSHCTFRRSLL